MLELKILIIFSYADDDGSRFDSWSRIILGVPIKLN